MFNCERSFLHVTFCVCSPHNVKKTNSVYRRKYKYGNFWLAYIDADTDIRQSKLSIGLLSSCCLSHFALTCASTCSRSGTTALSSSSSSSSRCALLLCDEGAPCTGGRGVPVRGSSPGSPERPTNEARWKEGGEKIKNYINNKKTFMISSIQKLTNREKVFRS